MQYSRNLSVSGFYTPCFANCFATGIYYIFAFFICELICSFQFSLSSIVIPRYFKHFGFFDCLASCPEDNLCFDANLCFALISSPLDLHHTFIFFRYLREVSMMVFLSDPVWSIRRSSPYARRC